MFCNECNLLIHEGEVKWVNIYGHEIALCPMHDEFLLDISKEKN